LADPGLLVCHLFYEELEMVEPLARLVFFADQVWWDSGRRANGWLVLAMSLTDDRSARNALQARVSCVEFLSE
jgi:hypothetical protein